MRRIRISALLLAVLLVVPAILPSQDPGKKTTIKVLEVAAEEKIVREVYVQTGGFGFWQPRDEPAPDGKKWLQVAVDVEIRVDESKETSDSDQGALYSVGEFKLTDESSGTYGLAGASLGLEKPWKFISAGDLYVNVKDGVGKGKFVLLFAVPSGEKRFLLHAGDLQPMPIDLEKRAARPRPRKS